ncbi:hypothetical protein RSAG8_13905, partial [Rhizoctonia solani AG-8 WAC10335]
MDREDNATHAT